MRFLNVKSDRIFGPRQKKHPSPGEMYVEDSSDLLGRGVSGGTSGHLAVICIIKRNLALLFWCSAAHHSYDNLSTVQLFAKVRDPNRESSPVLLDTHNHNVFP